MGSRSARRPYPGELAHRIGIDSQHCAELCGEAIGKASRIDPPALEFHDDAVGNIETDGQIVQAEPGTGARARKAI